MTANFSKQDGHVVL